MKQGRPIPERRIRLGVYGAPLDTGNLGVSALGTSVVRGLEWALPGAEVTLFDHGRGRRSQLLRAGDWSSTVSLEGCAYSRRFYRPSNQPQLLAAARLGLGSVHPFLRRLRGLDAILDISGGDSFADIYGPWRFRAVTAPKRLALALGVPLILLPQTYGPFRSESSRSQARSILTKTRQTWARDLRSLEVLRELLGPRFDAGRERSGVDVAFGLPAAEPADRDLAEAVRAFTKGPEETIGLNVSGLLSHGWEQGAHAFGLRRPYPEIMLQLARRLLGEAGRRLLLIPHVAAPCTPEEDDESAGRAIFSQLGPSLRARTMVVPALSDPMQIKWVIGRCAWFCGARMHSCIAGLSQGVPTAGIAYSDKALGVFETAGSGDTVFDARALDEKTLVDEVAATCERRAALGERLRSHVAQLDRRWREQFTEMAAAITAGCR